ncbi:hypothetical protein DL767_003717 [Monosporascus sp. MG133]|nr:hypothetical protein DL767_003717 [Monosporascus sp. MG133]
MLDMLINNAGRNFLIPLVGAEIEEAKESFDANGILANHSPIIVQFELEEKEGSVTKLDAVINPIAFKKSGAKAAESRPWRSGYVVSVIRGWRALGKYNSYSLGDTASSNAHALVHMKSKRRANRNTSFPPIKPDQEVFGMNNQAMCNPLSSVSMSTDLVEDDIMLDGPDGSDFWSLALILNEPAPLVLTNPSPVQRARLQSLMASGLPLFWVAQGSQHTPVTNSNSSLVHGLFHVVFLL